MSNRKPLIFLASIAPLQSAITIASDGGARVKLDLPETELSNIKRLLDLRGKVLRVTIQVTELPPQGLDDAPTEDTDRYFAG